MSRRSLESFGTRMKILGFMIEAGRPVSPKEINERLKIDHYPTVNYHLNKLIKEGVVIPLNDGANHYAVQPFMVRRDIDAELGNAIDVALDGTFVEHFVTSEDEKDRLRLRINALNNAFLYYVKYLLDTGRFKETDNT